jgi:hypothetical protein
MRMTSTVRHRLTTVVGNATGRMTCVIDHDTGPHLQMQMEGGSVIRLYFKDDELAQFEIWSLIARKRELQASVDMSNKHSGGTV